MVDFHTHILPKMDDGSKSVEQSIEMLRLMSKQNVNGIFATPHFYADRESPESFLHRRGKSYEALKSAITEDAAVPKIMLGAEVTYFEGISDCDMLHSLKMGATNLLLVEMPCIPWNDRMVKEIADIHEKTGLIPLIAHIDRYIKLFDDKRMADWFENMPVYIQCNASFFKYWRTSRLALRLLKQGKVHVLGTDCHNLTTRAPDMIEAINKIEKRLGKEFLNIITKNEKKLILGTK